MSEECTSAYEVAREEVRRLIGASSTREVVFTAGATASINTVAYSFERSLSMPETTSLLRRWNTTPISSPGS